MLCTPEQFSIKGGSLTVRSTEIDDAKAVCALDNTVMKETRFLLRESDESFTPDGEAEFIRSALSSDRTAFLVAELDGEIVGIASLNAGTLKRVRHRGEVALCVLEKACGRKVGTALMQRLIALAPEMGLEQLELEVVSSNERAKALYRKLGFTLCGKRPNSLKYSDGSYADLEIMVKQL